ncbi:hypothetical protein F5884DRAFT_340380 [Xylogone sp. PMI_703]|nr:hypothetical protein F5884DRAFT_340380 [Xylogone sp. PMI_703]
MLAQSASSASTPTDISLWSKWYQPGSKDDTEIYASALQKAKEINEQLNSQPWWDDESGLIASKIVESSPIRLKRPRLYDASWVQNLVQQERKKVTEKQASKSEWLQKLNGLTDKVIKIVTQIKPIIDIFIPKSPEYSIPYACLWIVFKGVADRRSKKDSILSLISSFSNDIPILQAYKDVFPTDEMKQTLAEYYIHSLDLLWKLARYYSHGFFKQLTDALLPRVGYDFQVYLDNVKARAMRLKTLGEIGHVAEQRDIKDRIDNLDSRLHLLGHHIEITRLAQARHYSSEIIDVWCDDIGDVEQELRLWQAVHFQTDMRDHWNQNGILPCITEWRKICDVSHNSILWISSESNGRQSWLTEFSIDLINVCRSHGQLMMFGMCDRPEGVKWTPTRLLKQLVSQLLNESPELAISRPDIFNLRSFRRATTFTSTFRLLQSIVGMLGSIIIVIDRLDLCTPDPAEKNINVAHALSILATTHSSSLRIIVTTGQVVSPYALPGLPVSFATVNTKRRPRRREVPPILERQQAV